MSGLQQPHHTSLPAPTLQENLSTLSAWLANNFGLQITWLLQDWHLPCMHIVYQRAHLQSVTQRAPLQTICISYAEQRLILLYTQACCPSAQPAQGMHTSSSHQWQCHHSTA